MAKREENYEIGFAKPPREHQFQPGRSGNPKGRPKGSRNLATIFREISNQKVKVKDNGGTRQMSKLEAIVIQITNKAATGDLKAAREYFRLSQSLPEDPKSLHRAPAIIVRFVDAENGRPKYPKHGEATICSSGEMEREENDNQFEA